MNDPTWIHSDDDLLRELRGAGSADPVPPGSEAAARSSFAWRTMDAELAELVHDSALEDERLAGVRGGTGPRLLTFEVGDITVEVEAKVVGSGRRLVGQVVPAQAGTVEARHRGGTVTVAADDLGCFSVDGIEPGPVSLCWRPATPGGDQVVTDWVII